VETAVSVILLLPVPGEAMLVGENAAVTPFGNPLTETATAELNPFVTLVVKVSDVEPPGAMLTLEALSVNVKLGTTTERLRDAVWVMLAPVPLITIGYVPAAAPELAVNVAVTGTEAVRVAVENATFTVLGNPLAESVTAELNPPCAVSVTVTLPEPPALTDRAEAFVASVKFGAVAPLQ